MHREIAENSERAAGKSLWVDEREPVLLSTDWRERLPVLHTGRVTLRELRASDAPTLCAMLTTEEVSRFISPPPTTVEGFERFIAGMVRQRIAGGAFCYGIVPEGHTSAVGLIQVRSSGASFSTAQWGFAIGSPFWGTGLFVESATMILALAFDTIGIHRMEARSHVGNARGHAVLRKLGAVEEARLRKSFSQNGHRSDEVLWSLLDTQRQRAPHLQTKAVWEGRVQ